MGDGAPSFSCAQLSPSPKLCADFEQAALVPPWTETDTPGSGTLLVDPVAPASGQGSLRASAPGWPDGGTRSGAAVVKIFSAVASDMTLGFDWELDAFPSGNASRSFPAIKIQVPGADGGTATYNVQLDVEPAGAILHEIDYRTAADGVFYDHHLTKQPKIGAWQHVQMHVILGGVASHLTMTLGPDTVVDEDLQAPGLQPSAVVLVVGVVYNGALEPHVARYDDVVFDF